MQFDWLNTSCLWLVTNTQACKPKTVPQVVGEVIHQGIDVVVFRDKESPATGRRQSASMVQKQCAGASVPFVVAHDLELALQLEAQAIHLGVGDQSIRQTRQAVGKNLAIGYSCHSVLEAREMLSQGADYVFIGPIFPSPEKLKYGRPLGSAVIPDGEQLPGPVVFIGGMDEKTIPLAMGQGAQRFAAIRAFQSGPGAAARVELITKNLAKRNS